MHTGTMVIVGAGQAGAWVAKTLRAEGYLGRVVLIGEESYPPYERPPLSKDVLAGRVAPETTYLLGQPALDALDIEWWAGEKVVQLRTGRKQIHCESGKSLHYDIAFLTTGGEPRKLDSLPDGERVHYLRGIADAQRLNGALAATSSVLVVGGGWIGLEVAATARQMGKNVTVLETGAKLCGRSLPAVVADHLVALHRAHGVDVRLDARAEFVVEADGVRATLPDGSVVTADLAVVGIGMTPRVALAREAGLHVENGIVVDTQGRSSDPSVFAVGDVANFPGALPGSRIRFESWANAQNSAIVAARAALGQAAAYDDLPWFWSDQFNVNLQVLGQVPEKVEPVLRDYGNGKASLYFLEDKHLLALVTINSGRDIRLAKRWMTARMPLEVETLKDISVNLQKMAG